MPQVITEGVNLAMVVETTLGANPPPSTGWINMQPNSLGALGPTYKKLARMPISKNRMNQRPILVDEESKTPWDADVTKDLLDNFLQGILQSAVKHNGGTGVSKFTPTAVTAGSPASWTVASSGALPTTGLVYGRGFANSANNGLHALTAGSTSTSVKTADTLVTESSPPANASLDFVGFQGASGDVTMDSSGNLASTVLDFTTFGLQPYQWIWVGGGTATAPGAFGFATTAYRGFAQIVSIAAHSIVLRRRSWTVGAADTGVGKTIQVFFSRWARNVSIDNADYLPTSYAFEVWYQNLGAGPVPEYEYTLGNFINQCVINLPLTQKATVNFDFIGTTSLDPTTTRVSGPSTATNSTTNLAVSTSTDLMQMRIQNVDETSNSTDFQMFKLTIKNNITPERQLGVLGATKMNVGRFEVDLEADVIFTSDQIIIGVHDNRQVEINIGARNGDAFGFLLDMPAVSIDSTTRKFETNKSVIIQGKTSGFQDATTSFVLGVTVFGYLPAS